MGENAYRRARSLSESTECSAQELNRRWWESLPMTYAGWEEDDRRPGKPAEVERAFLESNPWLAGNFDFRKWRGKRVLEIGCGAGAASCLFAKAQAEVVAIDLTVAAARLTRANALGQGLDVAVLNMDAERTAFGPESFDFVFSWGVLHHSGDPEAAFGEVARLLRKGGEGLVMVYNRNSLRYYLKGLYWLLARGRIFGGDSLASVQRHYTDGYYHRHYTSGELVAALAELGLNARRVSVSHMAKKMIPWVPLWLDGYLKRTMGWLLIVEFVKE